MPRLRFLKSYGSPDMGGMISAGAVIELSDFWADRLIRDGVAVAADTEPAAEPLPDKDEKQADTGQSTRRRRKV